MEKRRQGSKSTDGRKQKTQSRGKREKSPQNRERINGSEEIRSVKPCIRRSHEKFCERMDKMMAQNVMKSKERRRKATRYSGMNTPHRIEN